VRAAGAHVAKYFCGEHDDARLRVDGRVARAQPYQIRPEALPELAQLLVGQRLERRRVKRTLACRQGSQDGRLRHQRLAAPRRRGHNHALPAQQALHRAALELVHFEGKGVLQGGQRRRLAAVDQPPQDNLRQLSFQRLRLQGGQRRRLGAAFDQPPQDSLRRLAFQRLYRVGKLTLRSKTP